MFFAGNVKKQNGTLGSVTFFFSGFKCLGNFQQSHCPRTVIIGTIINFAIFYANMVVMCRNDDNLVWFFGTFNKRPNIFGIGQIIIADGVEKRSWDFLVIIGRSFWKRNLIGFVLINKIVSRFFLSYGTRFSTLHFIRCNDIEMFF